MMAVPDLRVRQKQQELSGVKPGDILVTNQKLVFRSRDQCGPIRGQYYLMVDQGSSQGMEQEMKRTGRAWVRMFRLSLCQ